MCQKSEPSALGSPAQRRGEHLRVRAPRLLVLLWCVCVSTLGTPVGVCLSLPFAEETSP